MGDGLKAASLGLVQGLTEFLPVSSSAHLLALREALGFEAGGLAFDVSLHLATLLAVLLYFRREILDVAFSSKRWPVLLRLFIATLPSVVVGLYFKEERQHLSSWVAVAGWSFSGTYLLASRGLGGEARYAAASWPRALGIGLAQALAIVPGVSRSGSTITAGLWLGLSREEAAKFSFLLAIPAILGAGVLTGLDLWREPEARQELLMAAAVAMPVAFLSGLLAIHLLLRIVKSRFFHRFGWYNYGAAAAFAAYLLCR